MNKFFLLTILISVTGFSQQIAYGTGGRIYNSENQKIKSTAVRELLKNNEAALKSYTAGRRKKTWGNVLFYGGLTLGAINLGNGLYGDHPNVTQTGPYSYSYNDSKVGPELAIVGGAMVLASIPIKLGYTKKVKAAINEYNESLVYHQKIKPEFTLLANMQGLGVGMQF